MQYLIDTQIMIWLEGNPEKLSPAATLVLSSPGSFFLSKASVWELVIKISVGKIKLEKPTDFFITDFLNSFSIQLMDIGLSEILSQEKLPLFHKDPFDRLIIATAIKNDMTILSSDDLFDKYPVKRIW
jgi:PIN domain nuclease of toxin-antitoxin system